MSIFVMHYILLHWVCGHAIKITFLLFQFASFQITSDPSSHFLHKHRICCYVIKFKPYICSRFFCVLFVVFHTYVEIWTASVQYLCHSYVMFWTCTVVLFIANFDLTVHLPLEARIFAFFLLKFPDYSYLLQFVADE